MADGEDRSMNENSSREEEQRVLEDEEEKLDPRVKEELERLNTTADEINKLESELDHARTNFRLLLSESTVHLNIHYKKLGKCVNKARPYYDLLKQARQAQSEAQQAVVKFQRANSMYKAAKEMVTITEERMNEVNRQAMPFDPAWQEMLNHATMKFMNSEIEKTQSEKDHLQKASECAVIEQKLKVLEKDMTRTIPKARPYFELKDKLEAHLQQAKLTVEDLQRALVSAKTNYREALHQLEMISEEVHQKRQMKTLPVRTPGVGAEDDNLDLPSINLDTMSQISNEDLRGDFSDAETRSTDSFDIEREPPQSQSLMKPSPLATASGMHGNYGEMGNGEISIPVSQGQVMCKSNCYDNGVSASVNVTGQNQPQDNVDHAQGHLDATDNVDHSTGVRRLPPSDTRRARAASFPCGPMQNGSKHFPQKEARRDRSTSLSKTAHRRPSLEHGQLLKVDLLKPQAIVHPVPRNCEWQEMGDKCHHDAPPSALVPMQHRETGEGRRTEPGSSENTPEEQSYVDHCQGHKGQSPAELQSENCVKKCDVHLDNLDLNDDVCKTSQGHGNDLSHEKENSADSFQRPALSRPRLAPKRDQEEIFV